MAKTLNNGVMIVMKLNAYPVAFTLADNQMMPVERRDIPFVLERFGARKRSTKAGERA